jgi:hypothetical protein
MFELKGTWTFVSWHTESSVLGSELLKGLSNDFDSFIEDIFWTCSGDKLGGTIKTLGDRISIKTIFSMQW